ncbi:glycine--tRNA ligase [Candidatus Woesearchaeota archaeon]|jgi:glycyl-tRNA synthetase|nr:glycine--tRNA ligase [Candidatus Woesearchaeota archaeon]MBT4368602.1 glycine--tRNA ligase [Candidatus Woesearchaeota archaeon]MBT4713089.1 glycine--tRNA ligase [Candidatus Woesearchaeota archaeon]MBT6639011.1 glycine--tRNA ligase [Candidatus Woesearchaeota archaeon]MBT7134210.1 glycine--tRNA ligase [Candidatus Woesearchaeota archaeon]
MTLSIDEMASFCKKKGFVYPNSEIYGGMAGFFDFGPLGSELKKNLKDAWWKYHVQSREDIVGIDGSIITHPKVWKASGHVDCFTDVYVVCKKCKKENKLDKSEVGKVKCECGGDYAVEGDFNLMFKTAVGPGKGVESYLRPETAQLMFVDFKLVAENARMKLPFGIAQIGRAFRNEISPRNFIFRDREFEQMEIEYFIHPDSINDCPFVKEVEDVKINVYSAEMQEKNEKMEPMKLKDALGKNIIKSPWHAYWLGTELRFFLELGCNGTNFRIRQHEKDEKAHYSTDCWDLEYKFPFGWKELQGIADRGQFDLKNHIEQSGKDLSLYDEEKKEKVIPAVVAEPSLGVERSFLVLMYEAYEDDKKRGNIVLHFNNKLAPTKVMIFPLVNKLKEEAREVFEELRNEFICKFDSSGSIGRRYARADEEGTPFCVTVDFEEDGCVTVRDRDSTEQERVKIDELKNYLQQKLL